MALGSRKMTATAPGTGAVATHDRIAEREQQLARRRRMIDVIQGQGLLLVFVVVFVIMWVESPYFFTINNLATAAGVVSVLGVMAVAETMVIIGEIDVSIGSVMALSSVLIGMLVGDGLNPWLAALVAALAAAGIGLTNGVLVVWFKINSLVVTLGMYSIALGIAYMLSNSSTVIVGGSGFEQIGSGNIWKLPIQFYVFLGVWAAGYAILRWTALGRHIYAVGNNYDAAVRAGIRADMLRIGLFITIALSAALAGVIVTSELSSAAPRSVTRTSWPWSRRRSSVVRASRGAGGRSWGRSSPSASSASSRTGSRSCRCRSTRSTW